MTKTTILAIDPGSREFGYAICKDDVLDDAGVKSLRRPHHREARDVVCARVFTALLRQCAPRVLVLEKNSFEHVAQNDQLMQCIQQMHAIAARHHVPVYGIAANTVKKTVVGNARASKLVIARSLCAQYPHLKVYLGHRFAWQERYYWNMFDAIACAIAFRHFHDRNEHHAYAAT